MTIFGSVLGRLMALLISLVFNICVMHNYLKILLVERKSNMTLAFENSARDK